LPTSSSETNVATSSQVVTDFYSNHRVVAGSCTVDLSGETARLGPRPEIPHESQLQGTARLMIALHGSRLFSAAMGPRGPERRQGCARHQRWISHDKHLASSVLSMCVLYARDTVYLHVLTIFKSQLRILSAVPTMESVCAAMPTYLLHPSSRSFPRTNGPSDQANELSLMQRVLRLAAVANESCAAGC
jgi:hypothetical protein